MFSKSTKKYKNEKVSIFKNLDNKSEKKSYIRNPVKNDKLTCKLRKGLRFSHNLKFLRHWSNLIKKSSKVPKHLIKKGVTNIKL